MPDDPILARKVAVLSFEYVARAFRSLAEVYGDGRAGLIVHAIFAANTAHLDVRNWDPSGGPTDAVLADEMRRPISIAQLARTLGMPFETVRQQVHKLIGVGV